MTPTLTPVPTPEKIAEVLRRLTRVADAWGTYELGITPAEAAAIITWQAGEIERLREENEAMRKEREWRPIESAPRDGTWILGWAESDSAPYGISWGRNHDGRLAWCTAFCSFVDGYITHYQSIPLPPTPQEPK